MEKHHMEIAIESIERGLLDHQKISWLKDVVIVFAKERDKLTVQNTALKAALEPFATKGVFAASDVIRAREVYEATK